jgi:hypothetical protein
MSSDIREDCVKLLVNVENANSKKQIADAQDLLINKLNELQNFNSDLYKPLTLAVELLALKKQDLSSRKQFIINIILALSTLLSTTILGILQIVK